MTSRIRQIVSNHFNTAQQINAQPVNTVDMGITTSQTTTQAEVPFYPFTPDFPNWEGDAAFTGSDYLLLGCNSGETSKNGTKVEDPLKDPKTPAVFLTPKVLKKVQYVVDKAADKTGECAFMLLGQPLQGKSRHFLMYDMFIAAQDATQAHVDLDLEDVARYSNYLKENWPEKFPDGVAANLHHGHSHGNLGVFWSSTDKNQQEKKTELGYQNDYRIFLVFNKAKQVFASLVMYYPVFFRIDDIPVGIYTGDGVNKETELTRAEKKTLDEQIDKLIKKPVSVFFHNNPLNWGQHRAANRGWSHYLNNQGDPRAGNNLRDVPDYLDYDRDDMWGPCWGEDWRSSDLSTPQGRQAAIENKPADRSVEREQDIQEAAVTFVTDLLEAELSNYESKMEADDDYLAWRLDELTEYLRANPEDEEIKSLLHDLRGIGFFNSITQGDFISSISYAFYMGCLDNGYGEDAPPLSTVLPIVLDNVRVLINETSLLVDTIFWETIEAEANSTGQWPDNLIPEGCMSLWEWLSAEVVDLVPQEEWTEYLFTKEEKADGKNGKVSGKEKVVIGHNFPK